MVRAALEYAPPSLCAKAYNWACYFKNRLPPCALNRITTYATLYNAQLYISDLRPYYTKCYAHIDKAKRPSSFKLETIFIAVHLVGYADSCKICCIYFSRNDKVDTVWRLTWEPSSYTSLDVYTPPLSSHLADYPPTIIHDFPSETLPTTTQTTASYMQQTSPVSYPETPLQARHPPLMEVPSPATNIQEYLEFSDDDPASERDSVLTTPIAGPTTRHHNSCTGTPSATKLFKMLASMKVNKLQSLTTSDTLNNRVKSLNPTLSMHLLDSLQSQLQTRRQWHL